MTKIKLCGIRRKEDVDLVNTLLPDYIGYVFAKSSKRYVSFEQAAELSALLDEKITPVGVFVDEPADNIISLFKSGVIGAAQLHGSEDEAFVAQLKGSGIPVIRAFKIGEGFDAAEAERSCADYILLDSGSGSGKTFDWSLIKDVRRAYFLAGGLMPENVGAAVAALHPYAVDASSSLETNGFKDCEKCAAFVSAVRGAN